MQIHELVIVVLAPSIGACGEISGLSDLYIADAAATTSSASGAGGASSSSSSSASSSSGAGGVMLPEPCSPTSTDSLRDDFDDEQIGPEWELGMRTPAILEVGGELIAAISPNPGSEQTNTVTSVAQYDFTDCHVTVRVNEVPVGAGYGGMLVFGPDGWSERVEFTYNDGALRFGSWLAGNMTPVDDVAYVPSDHVWWRMAEEGGQILFQAAPESGDFVTLASTTSPFDPTQVQIVLHAGALVGDGTGGQIRWDDLNRKP